MKNMFNVTTVLPHNLLQTNPCIRHKFSTQVFSKRAAQLHLLWRPENVAQLRAHIVKLCRALSEDLFRKVVTNARVRLQEVVRQNGGHIEPRSLLGTLSQPMRINSVPDVKYFVIIKICYVHNQWYDISCATLYLETLLVELLY